MSNISAFNVSSKEGVLALAKWMGEDMRVVLVQMLSSMPEEHRVLFIADLLSHQLGVFAGAVGAEAVLTILDCSKELVVEGEKLIKAGQH